MEKIFIELNNKRGLGVVWNNMAEALSNMKDIENYLDKALEHFNKAINNAEEQIEELDNKISSETPGKFSFSPIISIDN